MVGLRATTEHLGQLLPAAAALFMATATAALLYLDFGLNTVDCPNHASNCQIQSRHAYQRLFSEVSRSGRNLAATDSRARKIRERTVPMGQFMMPAISS
jgi:hypothetical protein